MRLAALIAVAFVFGAGIALGRASGVTERATEPSWSVAGELSRPRAYARAALVGTGEILVVGGLDAHDVGVTLPSSELFDPSTGKTRVLPQRLLGRLNQTVTVAWGDRVVVAGGSERLGEGWNSVAKVDVYLPWSHRWLSAAPLLQARSDHAAAALPDGRVLVTGGNYNAKILRSTEIYDARTDTWSPVDPLPRPRTQLSALALPDGSVLVAGGFQDDGRMTRATHIFEPWTGRWTQGPEMLEMRLNHSTVTLPGGDVLFFGGERPGSATAERYLWRERRFAYAGSLGEPRLVAQGAALADGTVVAVGGLPDAVRRNFDPITAAEIWDPKGRTWRDIANAPTKRAYAQLIATDHALYRLSGVGEDENPYTSIEQLAWP